MEYYDIAYVYELVNIHTGKRYIGSTHQHPAQRLYEHRYNHAAGRATSSIVLFDDHPEDVIQVILETMPRCTPSRLAARERYYILAADGLVNKVIPKRQKIQNVPRGDPLNGVKYLFG